MEEQEIRDFLLQNPDYLQRNPELLGQLQIPHGSGSAVSLVERQVSVLRERNVDLRHRLRELGTMARDNDQLFADTRTLVLALLEADSIKDLHDRLMTVLRDSFGVEYASFSLFEDAAIADDHCRQIPEAQSLGRLGALLGRDSVGCGPLRAEEFEFLFPASRILGSAAVTLVQDRGQKLGLLAVGSSDAGHYESGMGTMFLEFAAEVMARRLTALASAGP